METLGGLEYTGSSISLTEATHLTCMSGPLPVGPCVRCSPLGRLKKVKVKGTQQVKTQGHGGKVLGKASSFQLAGQESWNKREPFTEVRVSLNIKL